jgi:glucosamine--fructose-6-phosphate aminotransferase (isomerizing)
MCGIIGYIGDRPATPVLLAGLRRLEYRGYDSAGVAVLHEGQIETRRSAGKIAGLEKIIGPGGLAGSVGLGHTRWATHGRPSEENAHPHRHGPFVVVHNGIIENHLRLRKKLEKAGHTFLSETDTEIIAVLLAHTYRGDLAKAVSGTLRELEGSYAVGIICSDAPDVIVGARQGSPLVIGVGEGENFLASDVPAFLSHTRDVIYLDNGEVAFVGPGTLKIKTASGKRRRPKAERIAWDPVSVERLGFKHFMLKEIHEQKEACLNTFRGRFSEEKGRMHLEEAGLGSERVRKIRRVRFLACGTSYYAGLVGEHMVERLAGLPAEVDLASEFRYRGAVEEPGVLTVAISQSGETADTLAAFGDVKSRGGFRLAVCNVVGSTLAREAEGVLYTHAGPEIGVASTKAFTSQLTALYLLALHLGRSRGFLTAPVVRRHLHELLHLPSLIDECLALDGAMEELAREFYRCSDFLYLGRGVSSPIALEGALKLKEISYIHAEAYAGGEMKHGPIALIDSDLPVVVLAPADDIYDKMFGNIQEVKARDGIVIAFTTKKGERGLKKLADHCFRIPDASPWLTAILMTVPLQLFAYHVADKRGNDVDQPRNLAKSVTVE